MQISPTFTASQYVKRLRMEKYGVLGTCDGVQRKKGNRRSEGTANYTVLLETSCARMTNGMYASGDSVTLESKKIGEETIFLTVHSTNTHVPPAVTSSAQTDLPVVTQLRKQKLMTSCEMLNEGYGSSSLLTLV